jgi:hypothetical protein
MIVHMYVCVLYMYIYKSLQRGGLHEERGVLRVSRLLRRHSVA